MVEIFSDRIEFFNVGEPLAAIERIVDTVPVSRNENIQFFYMQCMGTYVKSTHDK